MAKVVPDAQIRNGLAGPNRIFLGMAVKFFENFTWPTEKVAQLVQENPILLYLNKLPPRTHSINFGL